MRALHITFRYGKGVYGGAEYHMRKLTEELHKKGVDVDICTTKTHTINPLIKSGVLWDNLLENETINGIDVFRFRVKNPNKYLSLIFEKFIQNRLDKEEILAEDKIIDIIDNLFDERGGILLNGWNYLEKHDTFSMRWSKQKAIILINETNVREVTFSILNNKRINGEIVLKSMNFEKKIFMPKNNNWKKVTVDIPNISNKLYIIFNLKKVRKPLKDIRSLGIAISEIKYKTDKYEKDLNLENDYKKFLISKKLYIDYLVSNTNIRPEFYCDLFDYLRGPDSPEMMQWLEANIEKYDVIMAQMFPFNTIKYSMIAKKYNKPLILMPLMHVDDDFYHWKHYYNFLRSADLVLANSGYSKMFLFDKIGVNSIVAGVGIDKDMFLNEHVEGNKFKKKYNLLDKNIILTVSRKSPIKRYDLLIKAMDKIKNDFQNAKLIMIGPDEDKVIIDSEYVEYLGKVSEQDLINAYDACDIFAMMSESESFGMVFCEAWARKKPVIGNINCGAVSSLIENGVDGFLCADVESIIENIEKLLNNRGLIKKMGENGYNKVINNFTWDIIGKKIKRIYERLC